MEQTRPFIEKCLLDEIKRRISERRACTLLGAINQVFRDYVQFDTPAYRQVVVPRAFSWHKKRQETFERARMKQQSAHQQTLTRPLPAKKGDEQFEFFISLSMRRDAERFAEKYPPPPDD